MLEFEIQIQMFLCVRFSSLNCVVLLLLVDLLYVLDEQNVTQHFIYNSMS